MTIDEAIKAVNECLMGLDVGHPGSERVRNAIDELQRARGAAEAAQLKIDRAAWHERVRVARETAEAARAVGRERRRKKAEYAELHAAWRAAGQEYVSRIKMDMGGALAPAWVKEHPIPTRDEYIAGAPWPYPEMIH